MTSPLSAGALVPDLVVLGVDGATALIAPRGLTLVWFFRGRWCPFCNTYLADISRVAPEISRLAHVRVVSSETVAVVVAHSAEVKSAFPIFSDPEYRVIDAFGVRHVGGGPGGKDIPRPAYFIIDSGRRVLWSHVGMTPTDRPEVALLVAKLRDLSG